MLSFLCGRDVIGWLRQRVVRRPVIGCPHILTKNSILMFHYIVFQEDWRFLNF